MKIASLGSGSKGNCTVVACGSTHLLVDCGFSLSKFEQRLDKLSLSPADIDALLVTHEHTDHGSGVKKVARKFDIPLYMTVGTARALDIDRFEVISGSHDFQMGDVQVQPVTVPHDAQEPVQFVFTNLSNGCKLGLLTDCGHVTDHMKQVYNDCHGLLLEFNYDERMLAQGAYPASLKQRISGNFGHLSNVQSMQMLQQINNGQLKFLIAAHLSENNNSPHLVEQLLAGIDLPLSPVIACQNQGFEWRHL
jgi:phosphoribosyl 1,2-cyclic phosphodiesterase